MKLLLLLKYKKRWICSWFKNIQFVILFKFKLSPLQSTCSENISDVDEDDTAETIKQLYDQIDYKGTTTNVSTEVTSGDLMVPFISIINSSKNVYTLTGIPSFELLNKIEELYRLQFPDKCSHNLSYKERIVIVFMKFKQDLPFVVLSILFKNIS